MAIECIYCRKRCSNLSGATRHLNHCIRRKGRRIYTGHADIEFQDRLEEFEAAHNDNGLGLTSGLLHEQQMQLAEDEDHAGSCSYPGIDQTDIEAHLDPGAIDTRSDEYTGSRISSRGKGLLSTDSSYTTTSFEEVTGNPAGTAFSHDNDSPSASYNNSDLTLAEVLDTRNFYPFDNELQYSLSLWFLDSQLSAAAIDSYIRNEAINPHGRPFKDCKQWLSVLESIPYGIHNDAWQRVCIEFPDELDNGTGTYTLYYRDVTKVIRFLIGYLPFRDYLHYAPVRLYTEDADGKPQRVYTELYTADWWWYTQEKLPSDATIIPVLLGSDKTVMTQHRGDRSMWPIYLSIGNLDGEIRRSQKLPGSILIGLIPVPTSGGGSLKRELYHKAMGRIMEPLTSLSQNGIPIQCADRKLRQCYPILAGFMSDYEEQVVITCVKSLQHCTICEVPPTMREKLRLRWPVRTHESMKSQIRRQRRQDIDKSDPSWVHPTKNFAWAHPYTNIHQAMMMDILHQLYKGVVEHMNRWVNGYFAHKRRRRAGRGIRDKTFTKMLDYRFKQVPPFTGLKRFHNQRFSKVRQWTGNEYRDMIRQYAAVVAPLIKREDAGVMLFVRAILDFVTLSEYHSHTDETLEYLNHALERIDDLKYTLQGTSSDRPINFNFPKFHVLSHYTDFIRYYGSLVNHNSAIQENFHKILLKEYYDRTNKQDNYEEQILKHNTRRVNVQAMQGIISFRSTMRTIDENHSSLDSRSNKLSPPIDLTDYPLTDASRTRLQDLGLSQRSWRLAADIASRLNTDGLLEAIALFVQEHRTKRGQTDDREDGAGTNHGRVREDNLSWVASLPMQLHSSLSCYKFDGKDTRDPNKRTKEIIRCSEDWRRSGSARYDFVWVQEYGCLDKSTSEVEQIQGRKIGRSILFITVKDVECGEVLDGEAPQYYGAILSMMRLRQKGRAHAIHGMIEVEDFPEHTAPKGGRNGKICCYDIQTVHRSVHAVPARLDDNNKLWYVNNFIDWDSYNTLFNTDWREENKREVTKVKRRLRRQIG